MRLIDGDKLIKQALEVSYPVIHGHNDHENGLTLSSLAQLLDEQPVIEHESPVLCKDCKHIVEHHYEENGEPPYIKYTCAYKAGLAKGYQVHGWDFCSRAERRER